MCDEKKTTRLSGKKVNFSHFFMFYLQWQFNSVYVQSYHKIEWNWHQKAIKNIRARMPLKAI